MICMDAQARWYLPGPDRSLDHYAVSPSPCAPRCTYIPVGKKRRRDGA
jgi:hypothetical protein